MDAESVYCVVLGLGFGLPTALAWSGRWRSWHGTRSTPGDPSLGRHLPLTLMPALALGCLAAGTLDLLPALALVLGLLTAAFLLLTVGDAMFKRVPPFLEPGWARREHR